MVRTQLAHISQMDTLLVIDVGNTNTVLGLYQGAELKSQWRVETNGSRTADEYAVLLQQLMGLEGQEWGTVGAAGGPPSLRAAKRGACWQRDSASFRRHAQRGR